MPQSVFGKVSIWDDFLGPDNDLTWGTGTVLVGNFGFVSVNEGSFEWTVDEPGGILAITTDTGDDDNAALIAGTFSPDDGPLAMEARFKIDNVTTESAIFVGFAETMALATPVMPAEFATATMTYNGTGGMIGLQFDIDGTTDDFRAVMGDGGAAISDSGQGTRANATMTVDEWYIARVEVDNDGSGRCYLGHDDGLSGNLALVKEFKSGTLLTPTDQFYAVLMVENRTGAANVFEVDYMYAEGYRDWRVD